MPYVRIRRTEVLPMPTRRAISDRLKPCANNGSDIHVMLTLRRSSRQVVVADKQFDRTDMMGELFGKRQRVADQP
jgi:hypothetical protein